ncbi:RNA polymerase sigma factor [Candidatus Leptofilum sp.]|uniref:RNA polymerase sigma factor n=1 Tax=Candidatus Leptofilum sp. TaxID=3241576 RepID=UPI003B58F0AE
MLINQPVPVPQAPIWLTIDAFMTEAPVTVEDDRALVQAARAELRAFNELYERHVMRVYRYLLVRVGNVADAEDLTSQTFLVAMENLDKYRGERPFLAWLFGIARHKVADKYRQQKPELMLEAAGELVDTQEAPDSVVSQKLQIEAVAEKLQTLSPDRAEAISLRLFGGLGIPEIARLMHKQEPAVRMLLHRGLQDLQTRLNPNQEANV